MKSLILIVLIALMAMSVAGQRGCGRIGTDCQSSVKCCSSWCHAGKCKAWWGQPEAIRKPHPCDQMRCSRGRCVIEWVRGAAAAKCIKTW